MVNLILPWSKSSICSHNITCKVARLSGVLHSQALEMRRMHGSVLEWMLELERMLLYWQKGVFG